MLQGRNAKSDFSDLTIPAVKLGPLGTAATNRPIVPDLDDYDDVEIGGMIGRGSRSTRRKPAPVPLCPPQTPHAGRTRSRAAAVGSQRLTAWATARPRYHWYFSNSKQNPNTVTCLESKVPVRNVIVYPSAAWNHPFHNSQQLPKRSFNLTFSSDISRPIVHISTWCSLSHISFIYIKR
jgi:hypothetical protein